MLSKIKKTNNEGFTIIEVMIVLAVAALILLIVLLAVPALQKNSKNTALKNDASTVAGAVSTFTSDNDGTLPGYVTGSGGVVTLETAEGTTTNDETANIQGTTTVTWATSVPGTPAASTIYVITGYACGATAGATPVASASDIAVVYYESTNGGLHLQCQTAV